MIGHGIGWSAEEIAILHRMVGEGMTYSEISAATRRSYNSIKAQARRSIPKVKRNVVNAKKSKSRVIKSAAHHRRVEKALMRVPDDVIRDAARRAMAPRTITGTLMGDPPVGFSALEARA